MPCDKVHMQLDSSYAQRTIEKLCSARSFNRSGTPILICLNRVPGTANYEETVCRQPIWCNANQSKAYPTFIDFFSSQDASKAKICFLLGKNNLVRIFLEYLLVWAFTLHSFRYFSFKIKFSFVLQAIWKEQRLFLSQSLMKVE